MFSSFPNIILLKIGVFFKKKGRFVLKKIYFPHFTFIYLFIFHSCLLAPFPKSMIIHGTPIHITCIISLVPTTANVRIFFQSYSFNNAILWRTYKYIYKKYTTILIMMMIIIEFRNCTSFASLCFTYTHHCIYPTPPFYSFPSAVLYMLLFIKTLYFTRHNEFQFISMKCFIHNILCCCLMH